VVAELLPDFIEVGAGDSCNQGYYDAYKLLHFVSFIY
jgi:hypothetical protein